MCLRVINGTNKRVAKANILVYKCLDYNDNNYFTPFQYYPIYFKDGKNEMKIDKFSYSYRYEFGVRGICVDNGIHSYFDKKCADDTARKFVHRCGTKVHCAIIPKGAKYYVGNHGDVVSTNLIIFETEEDYKNYVENNDEKICIIGEKSLSLQKI